MNELSVDGVVVMGVAGSGKSTIGALIADALPGVFVDADALHSAAAVAKMSSGHPLTDEDRMPWLDRVAIALSDSVRQGQTPVVACSARRRSYRDRLRAGVDARLLFVHLHGDEELLAARMRGRPGHFMPQALLSSQLATLEELDPDEFGLRLDCAASPALLVARVRERLVALDA